METRGRVNALRHALVSGFVFAETLDSFLPRFVYSAWPLSFHVHLVRSCLLGNLSKFQVVGLSCQGLARSRWPEEASSPYSGGDCPRKPSLCTRIRITPHAATYLVLAVVLAAGCKTQGIVRARRKKNV